MKKIAKEFREFISRGNVIDLAVGVIIGGAFTAIVNSLVNDMLTPLLGLITGGVDFTALSFGVGDAQFCYGSFLAAILNFVLVALVLFLLVKAINKMRDRKKAEEEAAAPTTKVCPFCKTEIDLHATRCPHCTSELGE